MHSVLLWNWSWSVDKVAALGLVPSRTCVGGRHVELPWNKCYQLQAAQKLWEVLWKETSLSLQVFGVETLLVYALRKGSR